MSTRARPSPLTANLGELALADLLQTLVRTGKDAVVTIRHDGKQSHVWCEAGRIIDAESSPFVGGAAIGHILSIQQGHVTAVFERVERAITIHQPLDALILEHMRLLGAASMEQPLTAPRAGSGSIFGPSTAAANPEPWQDALTAEAAAVAEDEPTAKQRQTITVIQKPTQQSSSVVEPKRRRSVRLVLLASAFGVGLGSWLGLQWRRSPAPPALTAPVAPLRDVSPATEAPISLDIWAEPAHAELRLDGSKIAVGHAVHRIADDGREHALEVSADGYHTETLRFTDVAPSGRVVLVPNAAPPAIAPPARATAAPPPARPRRPRSVQTEALGDETKTGAARPTESTQVLRDPKIRVIEATDPKIKILE